MSFEKCFARPRVETVPFLCKDLRALSMFSAERAVLLRPLLPLCRFMLVPFCSYFSYLYRIALSEGGGTPGHEFIQDRLT